MPKPDKNLTTEATEGEASDTTATTAPLKPKDTAKVHVRRTKHGEETVTGFSYLDPQKSDAYTHVSCDEKQEEFEFSADAAAAAVKTGGFAVMESSKSETKEVEAE